MSEEATSRENDLFRTAVDLAPAGMLAVDESGIILLVNREIVRLFGYEKDELLGAPVEKLIPTRFSARHPQHRKAYFAEATTRPMGSGRDLYGLRKDGTEVPVEIGLNPVRSGERTVVLASVVDITTRRRTEEQLRQSQKMEAIGTLAGGIAHDFNNLLLSIIGHSELALAAPSVHPEQRRDLDQILRAAERGRQLVQRILTFSRKREVARVPIQIEQTAREAIQLLRASLPTTVEIRERLSPATPVVLSDENQLHQVLMNLVTNAAHAMPVGGVLEVSSGPVQLTQAMASRLTPSVEPGLYARLRVRDTGDGMSESVLARVFEPFFTTKPVGRGSGLGLAVVHGIVQSHGGGVSIESRVGDGTQVDVFLPAHVGAASVPEESDPSETGKHVLLVDDEPALASMLTRQLELLGYRVTTHTSSTDALETFLAQPNAFDALVTDNTMPKLTGLALAQRLLEVRPDLPVLLTSGLAATISADDLHAMGIRKVLPKPHTMDQLGEALTELLGADPPTPHG